MKLFHPPALLRNTNIYEVNIRQYSAEGTFNAFALHLPRLKEMGVEILWLMPVFPIGIINRKGILGSYYSIKDFYGINREFGSSDDFGSLVNNAHILGMRIIIDWVANHAAWDNEWTLTNPEFFCRDENGNFLSPYDWTDVIQIDHNNTSQQEAMRKAMAYWITQFDIDGFRADLAHLTPLPFWKEARTVLDDIKPDLIWLAETEEPAYHEAFDISYSWKWMHASEKLIKQSAGADEIISFLMEDSLRIKEGFQLYFTSNHDENSWNGTEYEKYGVYAKALAVFSATYLNAIPLIYSGQEIPNEKRLKFFEKDPIQWNYKLSLPGFYEILLKLRANNSVFTNERQQDFKIESRSGLLYFERVSGDDCVIVILNLSVAELCSDISFNTAGNYSDVFKKSDVGSNKGITVKLIPGEFLVLEKKA
ncbi:MAG: alpha-amylase family glycosyl hydrolase [Ferruginibacter sp.]